jgi:four helix bundle protein
MPIEDSHSMTPTEFKLRSKKFALRCLKAVDALPKSVSGRTIAGQLARSATSVAANYRAACRARSHAEFIARLGVFEEEADETAFWLEFAVDASLLKPRQVGDLQNEAEEMVKIGAASRITAGRNQRANRQSAIANRQ